MRWVSSSIRMVCLGLIKLYQWCISPLIGPRCRYLPSCSDYAHEAFATYPVMRALKLTLYRLLRCHPWGGSGLDPVPPNDHSSHNFTGINTKDSI